MKRYVKVIILLLCISVFLPAIAGAKKKKEAKPIIMTTGDIRESYDIIDIITVSIIGDNLKDLKRKLRKKALKLNADAVVSVKYVLFRDRIHAYGTAVKLKD
ncbi:MAG: hypothetical protein U9R52_00500 [Candidatus Omnitrophota bacterium]|nr:hypothetical protein [Candidatus Omnitrophota bacterium]